MAVLNNFIKDAETTKENFIGRQEYIDKVYKICSNIRIKAPIRFVLSCCVAKIDNPGIDIRKPYTEIKGSDVYSGRSYDEKYIQAIIEEHDLPCNATTAYLTPAFRNRNTVMLPDTELLGRNPELYQTALELLQLVYKEKIKPDDLFKEIVKQLIFIRNQNEQRIDQLLRTLKGTSNENYLSSEQIVSLLTQHLSLKNTSRLPVLIVAAAYEAVSDIIKERINQLNAHNAADKRTGAIGDIEIVLVNDKNVLTSYEMKSKKVTKNDIDIAIKKILKANNRIDNFIFITTEIIEKDVEEYAKQIYDLSGVEIAILDCIGFIKHFLHFFNRRRSLFLEKYQELVLAEPNSSVNQPLKEAFLAFRQAFEAD